MYIVLEIQMDENKTVGMLTSSHGTLAEAQNKYYTVLAYAAVSNLAAHSAVLCDENGTVLMSQGFNHKTEPEES